MSCMLVEPLPLWIIVIEHRHCLTFILHGDLYHLQTVWFDLTSVSVLVETSW